MRLRLSTWTKEASGSGIAGWPVFAGVGKRGEFSNPVIRIPHLLTSADVGHLTRIAIPLHTHIGGMYTARYRAFIYDYSIQFSRLSGCGRLYLPLIDIRSITAEVKGKRYSLIAVIRLSEWPVEVCERNLQEEMRSFDVFVPGPLRLAWKVLPFTAWSSFLGELRTGSICMGDFQAMLPGEIDDARMLSYIPASFGFIENGRRGLCSKP